METESGMSIALLERARAPDVSAGMLADPLSNIPPLLSIAVQH